MRSNNSRSDLLSHWAIARYRRALNNENAIHINSVEFWGDETNATRSFHNQSVDFPFSSPSTAPPQRFKTDIQKVIHHTKCEKSESALKKQRQPTILAASEIHTKLLSSQRGTPPPPGDNEP